MKIRVLLARTGILTTGMLSGALVTWATAMRLRYGYPFSRLFPQTCIFIPNDEVVPTFITFIVAVGVATVCFVVLFRRSAKFKQFTFGVVVATIAFSIGVYLTGAR